MTITKKILAVLIALVLIISPFVFVTVLAMALPPQYSDTFFGALNEKYDRLNDTEGKKIVVVGGSSVAFGLDSARLEAYTGMPVVNFGLYADLGTKIMLDLSLSGISEGDIVIIAPELDRQTLSLYFNNKSALTALDDDYSMMRHLPMGDKLSCLGAMYPFAIDKYSRYTSDTSVAIDSVYRAEYFNEYGDFALNREENIMAYYYDPNTPVELNTQAYGEDFFDFCDYLNKYIKKCERRGATVCFSYCPINEMAVSVSSNRQARYEFEETLKKNINCEFISILDDYILDAGYFFDTNFHLNDSGVAVRTIRLAKDLRITYGIMQGTLDKEPDAPELPMLDVMYPHDDDENARYFTFSELPNGAYGISGLTDEGKVQTDLTIPAGVSGRKVTTILSNAFTGTSVKSITIPADSNLVIINNNAFFGASELRELNIYKISARDIMPPVDFAGVHPSFVIHVPRGSAYADDYDWSNKAEYIYDLTIDS